MLLGVPPLLASNIEYPQEKLKRYSSFGKCLSALKALHLKEKAKEGSRSENTDSGVNTQSVRVSDVRIDNPKSAQFTTSIYSSLDPKPGGRDGYSFGSGVDWICEGREMLKGGGHSALNVIPARPAMPEPPPIPAIPKL